MYRASTRVFRVYRCIKVSILDTQSYSTVHFVNPFVSYTKRVRFVFWMKKNVYYERQCARIVRTLTRLASANRNAEMQAPPAPNSDTSGATCEYWQSIQPEIMLRCRKSSSHTQTEKPRQWRRIYQCAMEEREEDVGGQ